MATITIEQTTDILEGISDLRFLDKTVWEAIGAQLRINTQDRFDAQVAPDGTPWAPLSPAYAKKKREQDYGDKILHKRGYLRDKLLYQATDYELRFGSDRKYSALHQFGGAFKAFGIHAAVMPARPYLGLSEQDKLIIQEELRNAYDAWLAAQS